MSGLSGCPDGGLAVDSVWDFVQCCRGGLLETFGAPVAVAAAWRVALVMTRWSLAYADL